MKTWSRLTKIDKPEPEGVFIPFSCLNEWQMNFDSCYIYTEKHGMLKIFKKNAFCLKTGKEGLICHKEWDY